MTPAPRMLVRIWPLTTMPPQTLPCKSGRAVGGATDRPCPRHRIRAAPTAATPHCAAPGRDSIPRLESPPESHRHRCAATPETAGLAAPDRDGGKTRPGGHSAARDAGSDLPKTSGFRAQWVFLRHTPRAQVAPGMILPSWKGSEPPQAVSRWAPVRRRRYRPLAAASGRPAASSATAPVQATLIVAARRRLAPAPTREEHVVGDTCRPNRARQP